MAESVHGTEKRAPRKIIKVPKIFFGATRKGNDNLVKVSKHRKVIIEGSSGIVKINMDTMLREPSKSCLFLMPEALSVFW